MRVTRVDMFGAAPGCGSALDVHVPDGACTDDVIADVAAYARSSGETIESALIGEWLPEEGTFTSRIFNADGETPFGTHSLAGSAAFLVSRGYLDAGAVGRKQRPDTQWLETDGHVIEVPFTGPGVNHEIPADPGVFGRYDGVPRACGVGRGFTFVRVSADPRALPPPDTARMAELGLTDLTLFRWDSDRQEVLARVFAPGFGLPEDPGCLPAAAALGLVALRLGAQVGTPVTIRQVTPHGTESVLRTTASVLDGEARVRVTTRVWIDGVYGEEASAE